MRTTAVINNKGGVAKTVTVVNMAAILSRIHGKRVLVVDADAQGNSSEFLGDGDANETFATMLRKMSQTDPAQETTQHNVDLIAASDSLMDLDLSSVRSGDADTGCLKTYLAQHAEDYDFCLIDCPPAFNAASAAALIAADDVIVPIKLDAFSLRGMSNLLQQVKNMRRISPALKIAGVLPTMWYASEETRAAERMLRLHGLRVFPHIRASKLVDASTYQQRPLIYSSPRCGATVDYKRFVRRYLEGGVSDGV